MILRHKAPETRVGGIVARVAHHEEIVHTESVGIGGLIVDDNLAIIADLQRVTLVCLDATAVERKIVESEFDDIALLWNVERTKIVLVPVVLGVMRENETLTQPLRTRNPRHRFHARNGLEFFNIGLHERINEDIVCINILQTLHVIKHIGVDVTRRIAVFL